MKVHKILNNNVIVTLDDKGKELILTGRGIGFKKREGDLIDINLIEKQFSLNNKEILPKFNELLSEIPLEVLTCSQIIINYAKEVVESKLQDSIYISLTDHIHSAIERHKQGFDIPNGFLWEIKKFYPKEFQISLYALSVIKKRLGIELPEDEAGFITFHIINAQLNGTMPNIVNMTKIMREILNIVKYHFKFEYDEDCLSYQRFVTHLKFFAQRILNKGTPTQQDSSLYEIIRQKYEQAYLCTKQIDLHLIQQYQHPLTDDESLYLTIHIERLRTELKKALM
ncbi:PRD domain-containing protein [Gilliamella sp. B2776]|uniref:BglG family transcription antiterminator LicT n=1 Tax=unclassified Gilliamella TaxID=2685620 RepID=UPI00226AB675|nr:MULTISPECIES: PRD domain-containing protein [unclassified Gilliamella]MCX8650441.1 PRD domain-containing protein [Gilliamella sp. B2779]MCX8654513.1 PRD domain-containing protein [Gilliamella sp. B2737]MCX8656746.1 PRD domain-containing protein [Gilliamella sp. B2894]MCX8692289.1 PRD domain-containing protein [Gilliamella sp. B2776]MCX8694248.1 PRD domain-containing protein [Gilliamella sp. B2881]